MFHIVHKDTNRKIRTTFFIDFCVGIWFQISSKTSTVPFRTAQIASDFTCVYCATAVTIFGTTDVYEHGFSYLSISIFNNTHTFWYNYCLEVCFDDNITLCTPEVA